MHPDPLSAAFDGLAERAPHRTLLLSGTRTATVSDLAGLARAAGRALVRAPAPRPGEPVGLQAANGPGALAALLALRRAGLAAVLLDAHTPDRERDRVAGQVGARFALRAEAWPRDEGGFELRAIDPGAPPVPLAPATAVVKLSSGSTGQARGIAATAASLLADERQLFATMGLRADDRLLAAIPFSHSYGLSSLVVPALVRGLPLVLPAADDPFAPLQAAAASGATVFPTVPAYLGALTRLAAPPPLPPELRLVISAGAPLPAETSRCFRRRFGLPVHVFYGASEAGGICYDREGGAAERGTVGSPVTGVEVELVDDGRVAVRSPAVAAGYLPPNPERLSGGRYLTDDLGRWQDGELALTGRLNELINVRGRKVNPREVEGVLTRLEGVEEAVVTAAGGETGEQHVRAIVACPPETLSPRRVLAHCRRHLADYKRPRSVILLTELPRTPRGKIDRAALADLRPAGPEPVEPVATDSAAAGRRHG